MCKNAWAGGCGIRVNVCVGARAHVCVCMCVNYSCLNKFSHTGQLDFIVGDDGGITGRSRDVYELWGSVFILHIEFVPGGIMHNDCESNL